MFRVSETALAEQSGAWLIYIYYILPEELGSLPLSGALSGTVVWDRCLTYVNRCLGRYVEPSTPAPKQPPLAHFIT